MSEDNSPVTHELCEARMQPIADCIEEIRVDIHEIKTKLDKNLNLQEKVKEHDRFIRLAKRIGVAVLATLALAAITGVTIDLGGVLAKVLK
jgi:hypothetical protein